jgi:methyltransferase (TIGR00027 family)
MTDTPINDVSDTAFLVATLRAMEGKRNDALFHDPLAGKLAGAHGRNIVAAISRHRTVFNAMPPGFMAWMIAVRTRIIDDLILAAIAHGADAVLNLGAGLDTRPYRLDLPESLHWIEVDYPRIIVLKDKELVGNTPRCHLERKKLDLADLPARAKLFSELDGRFKNILVLTEGVVPYLSEDAVTRLAQDIRSQPSLKKWIVDYFSASAMRHRRRAGMERQMRNAPFLFQPEDYFGFFKQQGFAPADIRYLWHESRRYQRSMPVSLLMIATSALTGLMMSKEGRDERRKFAAYVLLVRTDPVF